MASPRTQATPRAETPAPVGTSPPSPAAAREGQTRYQALVEASAQMVWTTDPNGAVVEDSPSWRAFTGQTYEQWKGSGWLDAVHPEDRERIIGLWQRAVSTMIEN